MNTVPQKLITIEVCNKNNFKELYKINFKKRKIFIKNNFKHFC